MATPKTSEARRFFRCALQRRTEADVLFDAGYHTGAVYLAGYGVECILKALLLSITPHSQVQGVLALFRGGKAHDYNQLWVWYRSRGGPPAPTAINREFGLVQEWSTDLRYSTDAWRREDADRFLGAARAIMEWARGRM